MQTIFVINALLYESTNLPSFRGRFPTLSLLCHAINKSSQQLPFLYPNAGRYDETINSLEATAYFNNIKNGNFSSRLYLTNREEARLIGVQSKKPKLPPRFIPNQNLGSCPVSEQEIDTLQTELDGLYSKSTRANYPRACKRQKIARPFPLDITPSSKLEADMMSELKRSWDAHQNEVSHPDSKDDFKSLVLRPILNRTSELRSNAEEYALRSLNEMPELNSHWHCPTHEILRVAGLISSATIEDLARIAINCSLINDFNPILNQESRETLMKSIITWLRLCVYEDKIARMISLCDSGAADELLEELNTKPVWSARDHPYWLVFEVENGIMIRQEQYKVAKHLIDNKGDVVQLNMGRGKVSVSYASALFWFCIVTII